jgi:hypothetical protein
MGMAAMIVSCGRSARPSRCSRRCSVSFWAIRGAARATMLRGFLRRLVGTLNRCRVSPRPLRRCRFHRNILLGAKSFENSHRFSLSVDARLVPVRAVSVFAPAQTRTG